MPYASLMVSVTVGRSNKALLRLVGDLAESLRSGVIGVAACRPIHVVCSDYSVPARLFDEDRKQIDKQLHAAEAEFRAVLQGRVARLEWRPRSLLAPLAEHLASEARSADLIVVGVDRKAVAPDATRQVDASNLVMQAGRPVLIVPETSAAKAFDRILVGWKETSESRRAVADSLPILAQAKQVTVAAVAATDELAEARSQVAEIVGWLGHHGVKAQALARVPRGTHAKELKLIADELGIDLVVAGAYGHVRDREWVLGGVTNDLLRQADRCSLLSH